MTAAQRVVVVGRVSNPFLLLLLDEGVHEAEVLRALALDVVILKPFKVI